MDKNSECTSRNVLIINQCYSEMLPVLVKSHNFVRLEILSSGYERSCLKYACTVLHPRRQYCPAVNLH
jgi:hypothetical protein